MFRRRPYPQAPPEEVADRLDDLTVLDVREPDEWEAGHIPGTVHIPMGELGARLGELDPDKPLLAVCRSGRRSGQVTEALNERGFTVTNLEGGLTAWQRHGLPLVSSDGHGGTVI